MPNTKPNAPDDISNETEEEVETREIEYLEGNISIVPNLAVRCRSIYYLTGMGAVFNGNYYFRNMTYSLSTEGLTVDGEVIKLEKVNYYKSDSIYDNRPDRAPAPPPSPSTDKFPPDYKPINRMGVVKANGGLHARKGEPFNLVVNSQGYVTSDASKAPAVGLMKTGYKVKVLGQSGNWYRTEYGGGTWSYARYIRLV